MIGHLEITDHSRLPISYWDKVKPLVALGDRIDFGPGMTILWGPNGCGKSTLLLMLARLTHCEQSGLSVITEESLRAFQRDFFGRDLQTGARAVTDGQTVRYVNPSNVIGLKHGAFDDDFFAQGLVNTMRTGSAGELTQNRAMDILSSHETKVQDKVGSFINEEWRALREVAMASLEPVLPVGGLTILADEMDLSLDIPTQAAFWRKILPSLQAQIIIATHSPFAANVPGASYIDIKPGYLGKCRREIAKIMPKPAPKSQKKKDS